MTTPAAGVVLALDQGSHASRALLFDSEGNELAQAQVPVSTRRAGSDRVEQEPGELLGSLQTAIDDVMESHPGSRPAATGLATQRSTVVTWQRRDGRTLTPALSWQDRRNAAWLAGLDAQAGRVREITGLPLSPHYGASKLRWCLEHVPAVRQAATQGDLAMGPLSSFLVSRLTAEGTFAVDPANASRTLLYDPSTLGWSAELLQLFDIEATWLPACWPTRAPFGRVAYGGSRVPITACTGDQSAAAFAYGRPDAGCALVNIGTGAFVQRVVPPGAPLPAGILRSVVCVDEEGTLISHEGTVNGAGAALDWLRERVALDVDRALATLSARAPLADDGPVFVNGVGGLGSPYWRADVVSEFVGDGDEAARLAAVVESVAFLLCENLAALQGSAPLTRIRVSGGLSRSDYLCRCLASLSGLAVERPDAVEATARGVAYLAAGKPPAWHDVPVERRFLPVPAVALAARFARWREAMASRC